MCGICGILSFASAPEDGLRAAVQAMADTLAHRGPDGEGAWVDASAGLAFGHRRLAIIDLSPGGAQPMHSANGRYVITYNGEIYNYRALRAELQAAGVPFSTQSDTEVLLAACAHWGVARAAERLSGIFAFALWDRETRVLSLVRDHFGIKPLYWSRNGNAFLFGSELRALTAHSSFRREIDRDALTAYFRHNYVPAPHTIYRNVFKLLPGHILTLPFHGAPQTAAYFDLQEVATEGRAAPLTVDDAEATEQLDILLRDAVAQQMVSDVPLGAFLSGGIDSSTVVALMQAASPRPVKTFTIGFREEAYDEAAHAKQVAQHLKTEHTELYVTPEHARAVIPSIADWFDEPFADASQIPTFLVSRLARGHVTVSLSGDGGDEIFAGYNRYTLASRYWRQMGRLPRAARAGLAMGLRQMSPASWDRLFAAIPQALRPRQAGDKLHKVAGLLALQSDAAVYRRLVSQWEDPASVVIGGNEPKGLLWDEAVAHVIPDFIERMQYLDTMTYLPDDILTKVDRASMAVSLEARVPLLDPRVVRFAWQLPLSLKLRHGKGKWLLRQVLHRYVPPSLVERPKMGFAVPIDAWLRGPLREWAEDLLDERRLAADGLLNPAVVRRKWTEHLSGHRNWQYALWCVLMFQEWKRRWLEDGASAPRRAATAATA